MPKGVATVFKVALVLAITITITKLPTAIIGKKYLPIKKKMLITQY